MEHKDSTLFNKCSMFITLIEQGAGITNFVYVLLNLSMDKLPCF